MPMTWPQVYRNCERKRRHRADTTVTIDSLKLGVSGRPKTPTAAAKVFSIDKVRDGYKKHKYVAVAKWLNSRGHIDLSCSCPDFMYTYEVALKRKGAAQIKYSDGELPVDRNPRAIPGACVAKGSTVSTPTGQVKIEDIKVGDYVQTLSGPQLVTASALTRRRAKVLTVTTDDQKSLTLTPDHKVYAVAPKAIKPTWVRADELTTSHHVISLYPTASRITLDRLDSEALVLGYLVSEHGETGYRPMEEACSDEFSNAYADTVGREFNSSASSGVILSRDIPTRVWSKLKIAPVSSREKELPEAVFSESLEYRLSLVYALFQGDGWISAARNAATYASQSKRLATQVVRLLAGVGVGVTSVSEEYSGDCGNLIYLVRVSRHGSYTLSHIIPTPAKYGDDYYDSDATKSHPQNRTPFNVKALVSAVQRLYTKRLLDAVTDDMTVVTLRSEAERVGQSTSLIAWARQHHEHEMVRVRTPNAAKPSYAAPRRLIQQWAIEFNAHNSRLPYFDRGGAHATAPKLLNWLSTLPPILDDVKTLYRRLISDNNVRFTRVISIQEAPRVDVYDITVENAHHFVANGIVVHNCKHLIHLMDHMTYTGLARKALFFYNPPKTARR